jgi:hypothetical protein
VGGGEGVADCSARACLSIRMHYRLALCGVATHDVAQIETYLLNSIVRYLYFLCSFVQVDNKNQINIA